MEGGSHLGHPLAVAWAHTSWKHLSTIQQDVPTLILGLDQTSQ